MRKDDDISGLELEGLSIGQLDDGSAVDDANGRAPGAAAPGASVAAITFDAGAEKPQGAENSAREEHSAVQLDSAQDFGECIHSVLLDSLQSSLASEQRNPLPLGRSSKSWRRSGMVCLSRRIAQL